MRCRSSVLSILFFLWIPLGVAVGQENVYVGAERCRSCHAKAFGIWAFSIHARAQTSLPKGRGSELRCLFCHATDAQANLTDYSLMNVQCEACHGAGSRHVILAIKNEDKAAVTGAIEQGNEQKCRNCHGDLRSPNLRPFNYTSAVQRIRHW